MTREQELINDITEYLYREPQRYGVMCFDRNDLELILEALKRKRESEEFLDLMLEALKRKRESEAEE